MAHHFAGENGQQKLEQGDASRREQPEPLSQQGQQSQQQPSVDIAHRIQPPVRSSPIAIRRNPSEMDTSDEDDDDSVIDVELDAARLGNACSLPSRLLRAPRLTSVPTKEDDSMMIAALPPPMNSYTSTSTRNKHKDATSSTATTSYGSLRESHVRGRFLDGPSSYRDKTTGDIRQQVHRVRFRDNNNTAIASSAPIMVSIGDRIRQSKQNQSSQERTSSLTAMLEESPLCNTSNKGDVVSNDMAQLSIGESAALASENQLQQPQQQQQHAAFEPSTFYDDEDTSQIPFNMLSTSLTGLEVLQKEQFSIIQQQQEQQLKQQQQEQERRLDRVDEITMSTTSSDQHYYGEEPDQLPRDAQGHNALLSRSFSDPTPQYGSRMRIQQQQQQQQHAGSGQASPALTSATRTLSNNNNDNDNCDGAPRSVWGLQAALPGEQPQQPQQPDYAYSAQSMNAPPKRHDHEQAEEDHNPDIEGAFDMDM